jgi:hypothetical protein
MKTDRQKQDKLPPITAAALERADEMMRRMLATAPQPFTPKKKGAKKHAK